MGTGVTGAGRKHVPQRADVISYITPVYLSRFQCIARLWHDLIEAQLVSIYPISSCGVEFHKDKTENNIGIKTEPSLLGFTSVMEYLRFPARSTTAVYSTLLPPTAVQ